MDFNQMDINVKYILGGLFETTSTSWHGYNICIPESKFYYVIDGEIIVQTQQETLIAKAGDLILIPEKTTHSFFLSQSQYAKKYWCHFTARNKGEDFFSRFNMPKMITIGQNEQVRTLLKNIIAPVNSPTSLLEQNASILSLCAFYLNKSKATESFSSTSIVDSAKCYIKENLSSPLSLNDIANTVHLSPNYLVRKFHQETGTSPLKYVNALRIEKAKELLRDTTLSITDIMERVGILDASYFSRLFRSLTGYSPRAFRALFK